MARLLVQMPDAVSTGDLNSDGKITIGELMASTVIITVLLAVILNVLVHFVGVLIFDPWPWLPVTGALAGLSVAIGCGLGIWRMFRYELGLWYWSSDRKRARKQEEEDRRERMGLTEQDKQARISQADVDHAVWLILERYFAGKAWARGKVPGVSNVRWNLANKALKTCKLRRARRTKLEAETFDEAWSMYLRWRATTRQHYVTSEGDLIAK